MRLSFWHRIGTSLARTLYFILRFLVGKKKILGLDVKTKPPHPWFCCYSASIPIIYHYLNLQNLDSNSLALQSYVRDKSRYIRITHLQECPLIDVVSKYTNYTNYSFVAVLPVIAFTIPEDSVQVNTLHSLIPNSHKHIYNAIANLGAFPEYQVMSVPPLTWLRLAILEDSGLFFDEVNLS